ncbi:MAG: hypothetical protein HQL68_05340 [Magnetococcales bacterium]|nr:hypothetical protein [Magnetococcales bacterium]
MKVTLTPKAEEIVASQVAMGNFACIDEAVNSFILSTQDVIERRLDELDPVISERMKEPEDSDIDVDEEYFEGIINRIKSK